MLSFFCSSLTFYIFTHTHIHLLFPRFLVEEKLEDFDFFIHTEDDCGLMVEQVRARKDIYTHKHLYIWTRKILNIHIHTHTHIHNKQVEAFREESDFLSTTHRANRFFPGFVRYELVNASSSSSSPVTSTSTETDTHVHTPAPIRGVWEGSQSDCQVEEVEGRWYVKTGGFSNQAGWMASREQVKRFNDTCNEPFFSPWEDGWVEYWSSIQIYEQCHLRKVFPLEQFDLFSMYHLSNNKLYHRTQEVTLTEDLKSYLYRLKDACVEHGLTDSFRLPDEVVARLQTEAQTQETGEQGGGGGGGGEEDTHTDKELDASLEEREEDHQAEQ